MLRNYGRLRSDLRSIFQHRLADCEFAAVVGTECVGPLVVELGESVELGGAAAIGTFD